MQWNVWRGFEKVEKKEGSKLIVEGGVLKEKATKAVAM